MIPTEEHNVVSACCQHIVIANPKNLDDLTCTGCNKKITRNDIIDKKPKP
jgi:hypothetical protein